MYSTAIADSISTGGRLILWGHGAGISTILGYDFTDSVGVALRGEYFEDKDGGRIGVSEQSGYLGSNVYNKHKDQTKPPWSGRRSVMIRRDQGIFGGTDNELTTAIDVAYMF